MTISRKIDICLTPSMLDLFDLSNKHVIVIDVFRATSAICVFLNNGGDYVIPVATVKQAEQYKNKISPYNNNKYLVAAERSGKIVDGYDLGNSPLLYHGQKFNGSSLVITTTNGTIAIEKSKHAKYGLSLASFLNVNSVIQYVESLTHGDILIVCSGWKGRICVEDMILAGLLSTKLLSKTSFTSNADSVLLANNIFSSSKDNLFNFLQNSSYLKRLDLKDDVKYCLQFDIIKIVPILYLDSKKPFSFVGFSFEEKNN